MAPVFVTKPEPFVAVEGEPARFCCRVTGWPRPRVMWIINGHTIVNVSSELFFSLVKYEELGIKYYKKYLLILKSDQPLFLFLVL